MATGRLPFSAGSQTSAVAPLARALELDVPAPLESLIAWMLVEDPDQRPSLRQAAAAFAALPDALPIGAARRAPLRHDLDPNRNPWGTYRRTALSVLGAIASRPP